MPTQRRPLTVIVPTGNRQDVIEDCLQSVAWADELLVVDSFTTDGTLEIAKGYATRVLQHEYGYSALQKNWAIPQAAHEWVLIVDTDERVSPELRAEIEAVLSGEEILDGYRIPRYNYVLGKRVAHTGYYPDYQLRLFRRDMGRYELRRVHAHVMLEGQVGTLKAPLIHYTHRSLNQTLSNLMLLMTSWEAEQRANEAKAAGRAPTSRLVFNLLLRPPAAFLLRYFRQGGWRDGLHGLAVSMLWAIYVAITYLKVWENSLELPEGWWKGHWRERRD